MYGMMKPNMPGGMQGFPMGGPDGPLGGMGPDMPNVMNGQLLGALTGVRNPYW